MNKKTQLLIIALTLVVSACNTDPVKTSGAISSVEVIGVSGNKIDLIGIWETACYGSSPERRDVVVFGEPNIMLTGYTYTTTDLSCGGVETVDWSDSASLKIASSTSAISAWQDGAGMSTSAPTAADNSGPLSDTESFTELTATITELTDTNKGSIGDVAKIFYIVDDTSTPAIMYDGRYGDGMTRASIVNPYTKQ